MNFDTSHSIEWAVAMLEAWVVQPSAEYLAFVYGVGFWAVIACLCGFYLLYLGRQGKRENRKHGSPEHSSEALPPFKQTEAN